MNTERLLTIERQTNMESDVKFSWTLLKKEYKPVCIGCGACLLALFFEKVSFSFALIASAFAFFLLTFSVLDFKYRLIFDKLLIYFLLSFFALFCFDNSVFPELFDGFLSGTVCGGFFLLLQILKKDGIGGGDIKFIFCLGFWLGFKLIFAIYIGVLLALVAAIIVPKYRQKRAPIPFAPFLSVGATVNFFCGEKLVAWYKEFFLCL